MEKNTREIGNDNPLRIMLDASFQGFKRLFLLAFGGTDNGAKKVERISNRKYFLPRVNINDCNILIDDRNSYDQPIDNQVKKKRLGRLQPRDVC